MIEWRVVEGYPSYEVSNSGDLRNTLTGKVLKPSLTAGYKRYCLQSSGSKSYMTAHRLVAITFLNNPDNLPQVNHIDANKLNNDVNNLEWCTAKQNMQHAWSAGLMKNVPKPPEKKRVMTTLKNPEGEVHEYDIIALAAKLGVSRFHFYSVANGSRKQHCGYTKP